jgi:hypothetical protein
MQVLCDRHDGRDEHEPQLGALESALNGRGRVLALGRPSAACSWREGRVQPPLRCGHDGSDKAGARVPSWIKRGTPKHAQVD